MAPPVPSVFQATRIAPAIPGKAATATASRATELRRAGRVEARAMGQDGGPEAPSPLQAERKAGPPTWNQMQGMSGLLPVDVQIPLALNSRAPDEASPLLLTEVSPRDRTRRLVVFSLLSAIELATLDSIRKP
jgi:hypothetical protein